MLPKDFLKQTLSKVAQFTEILIDAAKVQELLEQSKTNTELSTVLEDTKGLVNSIIAKGDELKSDFLEKYPEISSEVNKPVEQTNGTAKEKAAEDEDPSPDLDETPDLFEGVDDAVDASAVTKNDGGTGVNGEKEQNGEKEPAEVDKGDGDEDEKPANRSMIKLVDINTLMAPRQKPGPACSKRKTANNNINNNDSVVVITSSDDDQEVTITKVDKKRGVKAKTTPQRLDPGPIRRAAALLTEKKTREMLNKISSSSDSDDHSSAVRNNRRPPVVTNKITISSDSGSETDVEKDVRKLNNIKKKEEEEVKDVEGVSEISSLSDDSSGEKAKDGKAKREKKRNRAKSSEDLLKFLDWKTDAKFQSKAEVKVLRVPCEEMKEYYAKIKEDRDILRLTDLSTLKKRKQASPTGASDDSESQRDSRRAKRSRLTLKKSSKDDVKDSSSDDGSGKSDDRNDDIANTEKNIDLDETLLLGKENATNELVESVLATFSSDDENGDKNSVSSDSEKSEKDAKKKAKKKGGKDKNKEKSDDKENSKTDAEDSDKKSGSGKGSSDSDSAAKKKKKDKSKEAWKKDKLLTGKLSSSDSEKEFDKAKKKKSKEKEEEKKKKNDSSDEDDEIITRKKSKRLVKKKKKAVVSDSEDGGKGSADEFQKESSSSSSSESEKDSDKDAKKKTARKRVRKAASSTSEDEDDKKTRKQIRKVWTQDSLAETTKKAEAEEKERKQRIAEKQKKYNDLYGVNMESNAKVDKVVLDFDEETNKPLLEVDKCLVKKLKPHQANGIKFMWDACFESLELAKTSKGSGCILAHCMGLGKTLQVIALAHTLLTNWEKTNVKKVMVVCPLNTVLNWKNEFNLWLPNNDDYDIYELVSIKQNSERQYQVRLWHDNGGVLVIGYEMYRNLSNPPKGKRNFTNKMRTTFHEGMVDPGPDLVICDEGHLLKNEKTNISIAMNRLKTMRRIVLTGTPLQNNLKEYFCMVQFIKPNLLGTYKEYLNRFVNPITNGQYTDSTDHDIQIMRKRSHVLHKMLDGVVQRRDYAVLQPYLPPKYEYVLFLSLTEVQIKLYRHYLDHFAKNPLDGNRTSFLFVDFQNLQRICTHPRVLLDKSNELKNKMDDDETEEDSEGSLKDFIDDDKEDSSSSSGSGSSSDGSGSHSGKEAKAKKHAPKIRLTRAARAAAKENGDEIVDLSEEIIRPEGPKEWWQEYCEGDVLDSIRYSTKLFLLFEILKECEQIGDKVLVFSQSLYSLNLIEYFLERVNEATDNNDTETIGYSGTWHLGLDYFRLDGSSSCDNRNAWCKSFNSSRNTRARLFLISTRAGGLGINLVAANRVIIFDVSWNPSHDIQSIYRVYRFGQTKPSYIYRFVTYGTMEMKIYERQVTKQAISKRVIDEQQIDRHYNQNDLAELYKFEPTGDRPLPAVPKDVLLGELLQKYEDRVFKYHEHQSLLENKEDEVLNEEEMKAAWEEFENEKIQRAATGNTGYLAGQTVQTALISIIQKEHPTWTQEQVYSMVPALNRQMHEQLAAGEQTLYQRVRQEIQILNAIQHQKFREQMYMQQALRMQQQLAQNARLNPAALGNVANGWQYWQPPGGAAPAQPPNDNGPQ